MIIDAHTHFTTAPLQLQAYRGRQITDLGKPMRAKLQISDEAIGALDAGTVQAHAGVAESIVCSFRRRHRRHGPSLRFAAREPLLDRGVQRSDRPRGQDSGRTRFRRSANCRSPRASSPKEWVDELERCVKDLGFVSCNVNPDVAGGKEPLTPSMGSEWWYPLWEKMVELDVPCTMHASASLNPAMHLTNSYYIAHHNSAAVEILKSRVFKDFPKLKIIIPHGGGAIPYQWNRQRGMHVREGLEPFEEVARQVYWDMAIYDKESMELLIKRVGVDNVLFATEMFGAVNAIDPKTGTKLRRPRADLQVHRLAERGGSLQDHRGQRAQTLFAAVRREESNRAEDDQYSAGDALTR